MIVTGVMRADLPAELNAGGAEGEALERHLVLLGGCALVSDDGTQLRLKTRKSWALLALLAQARDAGCTREYLASLLWPRSGEEQARASLRQELAVLRKTLSTDERPLFDAQTNKITLNHAHLMIDTVALEALAKPETQQEARQVADLYKGEFAAGLNIRSAPFDDWIWLERQRLHDLAVGALEYAMERQAEQGDPQATLEAAQAVLDIDQTHEIAHQRLIKSLGELGRRSEALAQFRRIAEVMRRELDAEPSEETFDLYNTLRAQDEDAGKREVAQTWRQEAPRQEKRELTVAAFGIAAPVEEHQPLDAEDVSDLLKQMEDACAELVARYGGTLLGIVGDRCLAIFGYPVAGELMAERSVFAALELTARSFLSDSAARVQVCCGIANGETLVNAPEGEDLRPAHLSGAAVTQATTLSFMAAGGQVLINATTKALLRYAFETTQAAPLSTGNAAFQVVGEQELQNRFDVSERSNTLSLFTGRDKELARLTELWRRAQAGSGCAVSITGEPGIGKSRLLHTFLRKDVGDDVTKLQFSGSAHHQNTAFYPIVQEFRRLLRIDPGASPDQVSDVLDNWLADIGMPCAECHHHMMSLMGATQDILPPEATHEKPVNTLAECFTKMSRQAALVLVFEDLHWMDPSSQQVVQTLQADLKAHRIMGVITSRQDAPSVCYDAHRIPLDRLTQTHAWEIVETLAPVGLDASQMGEVISRSDGIPLFLEELMRSFSDETAAPKQRSVVPASLQETLMSRIDRMGSEKEILHIASVIGREFSQVLLELVAQYDAGHVERYLAQLQKQDLVYRIAPAPHARYEFKHALVQEMTYDSILRSDRKKHHKKIANVLKAGGGDLTPAEPEVIARHLERSGQIDQALDYLELAGRRAVAISAHREAVQHFRHALNLAQTGAGQSPEQDRIRRLLLLLGPQLLAQDGFASDEVREVYGQAKALSVGEEDKIEFNRVIWGLWSNYIVRADLHTAAEVSADFLDVAIQGQDAADMIAGHYMTGVSQFYAGHLDVAEAAFDQASATYQSDLHEDMILRFGFNLNVTSSSYLLWIYALTGRFDQAQVRVDALLAEIDKINHPVSAGFAHNFISRMHNFAGDAVRAEHHARIAIAQSDDQRFAQFRAQADINLGRALDLQGQPEGLLLLRNGLEGYIETGAKLAKPYAYAWLAEAYMNRNDPTRAAVALRAALAFSKQSGEVYFDAELLRLQAELAGRFALETADKVTQLFENALSSAEQTGATMLKLTASASLGAFLKREGREADAARVAAPVQAIKGSTPHAPLGEAALKTLRSLSK